MVYETFCKNLFEKTTKAICSGLKESIGIIKFKIGDLEMASSKDYLQFVLEQLSEILEYRNLLALHQMLPMLRKVFHHKFFQKLQPKKVLQNTQSIYILLSSYQSLLVYFQTKNGQPGGAGYLPYKHRMAGLPTSSHIIKCFAFLSLSF